MNRTWRAERSVQLRFGSTLTESLARLLVLSGAGGEYFCALPFFAGFD
jgi:hypothetical protein